MHPPASSHQRLHDLDALRAAAMLIGIVFHVALSFASGFPWMVQDVSQSEGVFIFQAWVHGFRMQLFMLLSGFFTALLWRQKGLKALLWHRCRRVLFPCLLGLIIVSPAIYFSIIFAVKAASAKKPPAGAAQPAASDLWGAIKQGSRSAVETQLSSGANLTNLHSVFGISPLQSAALHGRREIAELLLDRGAPVDSRGRDGHTALHSAVFLGHADVASLLIQRGADVNARSNSGETPLQNAELNIGAVLYISGLLGIPVDEARWREGRKKVQEELRSRGAKITVDGPAPFRRDQLRGLWNALVNFPIFTLIWFLWFLVWLVGIFSVYALITRRLGLQKRPWPFILSPTRLLWLVPLTMVPTWMMSFTFGPDTSMGVIPMPHVLFYYAIFFFFGVFYYDCEDREGKLGSSWRWLLPVTIFVIFPLALEFAEGKFGFRGALLPAPWHKGASVFLQSLFAWGMCFGSMGLFRAMLTRESHTIRYLSDSSYWLYLAHLPLCIAAQAIISQWPLPYWVKLPLLALTLTAFLLLTYHLFVRYTWIGKLLNGPRRRRPKPHPPGPNPGQTFNAA